MANSPLQGDDSHPHTMDVQRGKGWPRGISDEMYQRCHQSANTPGLNMPPGNPTWHLPPADMPMVFEGKSPHELALQLKDPNKNGQQNIAATDHPRIEGLPGIVGMGAG